MGVYLCALGKALMLEFLFAETELMASGLVHFIISKPMKIINMFTVWDWLVY